VTLQRIFVSVRQFAIQVIYKYTVHNVLIAVFIETGIRYTPASVLRRYITHAFVDVNIDDIKHDLLRKTLINGFCCQIVSVNIVEDF
jgi:hypothetical protein